MRRKEDGGWDVDVGPLCWGIILLLGYATVSAVLGRCRRNAAELAGLIIGLGAGNMGLLLFFLSLSGCRPSQTRAAVSSIAVLALLADWHPVAGPAADPAEPSGPVEPVRPVDDHARHSAHLACLS